MIIDFPLPLECLYIAAMHNEMSVSERPWSIGEKRHAKKRFLVLKESYKVYENRDSDQRHDTKISCLRIFTFL